MRKSLLFMWFISLTVLTIGTIYYPNNILFWLAAGTTPILIIRGIVSVMLLAQLFTNPPRNIWFRRLAGIVAISVGFWSLFGLVTFNLQFLDSLAFLGSSLAIGLTALERDEPVVKMKDIQVRAV